MTYKDAHEDLVKKELDVQSILKKVKDEYRTLHHDGKWPAASHAKDSKAMNRNYGSVNKATADLKKLLATAQVRSDQDHDKSKDKCNNCGELGHSAKDCQKNSKGGNGSLVQTLNCLHLLSTNGMQ